MPMDAHRDDDEDAKPEGGARRFREFDCPLCSASNPMDEPFGAGDEVLCFYCGQTFVAKLTPSGRLRLDEA